MSSELGVPTKVHNNVYDFISPSRLANTLVGKVALITGAGRGIGKAMALAFAEAGADVAILSRTKSQLEDVASTIRTTYARKVLVFAVDVTDEKAVSEAFETTERELGTLDVVIANAGTSTMRPLTFAPMDDWWRIMEVNVKGQILVAQEALKTMRTRGKGIIIFNTSRAAVIDLLGGSAYCASKAAVVRAAACLQLEIDSEGKDIQVFSLHPGGVRTELSMNETIVHPDMELVRPGFLKMWNDILNSSILDDTPQLSAWTSVFLATGQARELRGKYIDVNYDLGDILDQVDIVNKNKLYQLKTQLLGGVDFSA